MRIRNTAKAAWQFARVKCFGAAVPLAVRWQLTDRCVLKCRYCAIWQQHRRELSYGEILRVLDELARLGTQTISYSGGEPMLRPDIGEILSETKKRGISTEMNSTGALIPQNIGRIKDLDFLKISLDGPQDVHDSLRGEGSFAMAIKAAESAAGSGLRFIFTTTLTKHNIGCAPYMVSLAERYNTLVAFQPVKRLCHGRSDITEISPSREDLGRVISYLIGLKRSGSARLRNSLSELRHLSEWPDFPRLKCWAGKVFCIIDTDGTVFPCDRIDYCQPLPNCTQMTFARCLQSLPAVNCRGCGFCGVLELNLLLSLRLGALESIMKVTK